MTIQQAIHAYLLADGSLSALLGTRVHWARLPQNPTYPSLMLEAISSPAVSDMEGETTLRRMRVQATVYHPGYVEATAVLKALRDAIHGFSGVMGGSGGVEVESIDLESGDQERDGVDDDLDVMTKQLDFVVWFQEA